MSIKTEKEYVKDTEHKIDSKNELSENKKLLFEAYKKNGTDKSVPYEWVLKKNLDKNL